MEILMYLGLGCFFMLFGKRKLGMGQAGLSLTLGKGTTPGQRKQ